MSSRLIRILRIVVLLNSFIPVSLAKNLKVESFTPDPFDYSAVRNQKVDLNGNPCALIKIPVSDDITDLRFEGSVIDKENDGSEIMAYFSPGTKFIVIKVVGCPPCRLVFSDFGVYKLLSNQVYNLSLSLDNRGTATISESSAPASIHDLIDDSSAGDPIEDMVAKANILYAGGEKEKAIPLLKKAASLGHPEAQLSLGLLYEKGIGVDSNWINGQSEKESFLLVQSSAHQGYKAAQKTLSRYYLTGIGIEPNKQLGDLWRLIYEGGYSQGAESEGVFQSVELMPEYPGGDVQLMKEINANIHYPEKAMENNIQGRVVVQFVVKKDGSIGEVKVISSGDENLDAEAVRVVKTLKKFYPGKMNGVPVNVWYTLPIGFKLQGVGDEDSTKKSKGSSKK